MPETINWSNFYNKLCQLGPDLLLGVDEEIRAVIQEMSLTTDMFWSEELQTLLEEEAASDALRNGILLALEKWRENVITALDANFGVELERQSVQVDVNSLLIDRLIEAASPGR